MVLGLTLTLRSRSISQRGCPPVPESMTGRVSGRLGGPLGMVGEVVCLCSGDWASNVAHGLDIGANWESRPDDSGRPVCEDERW
jgi:hypothetical protein